MQKEELKAFSNLEMHGQSQKMLKNQLMQERRGKAKMIKYNVLDLFCGAGGLSCGFERAGFNIVLGIDNDKKALETFEANHPKRIRIKHRGMRTKTRRVDSNHERRNRRNKNGTSRIRKVSDRQRPLPKFWGAINKEKGILGKE